MKILFVSVPLSGSFGGIRTYSRELIDSLRDVGEDIRTVEIDPRALLNCLRFSDRIPRFALRARQYFWMNWYVFDYRFHNALARIVDEECRRWTPDIVHCMHPYLATWTRRAKLPTVVTCHGLEVADNKAVRLSLSCVSAIHCNSEFTRQRVLRLDTSYGKKTKVISWGIKDPLDDGMATKEFDLITVGRLVPRKNLSTVLRALQGRPAVRYAIVGDGPERKRWEEMATANGLKNVTFFGDVCEEEKWRLLLSSRVFIMCPLNQNEKDVEGLGLVYYEAQRCGLPIIAARSGGAPEAVGEAGIIVEDPLDASQLGEAIDKVMNDGYYDNLKTKVNARQTAASWERFVGEFRALYQRLRAGTNSQQYSHQ